MTIQQVWRDHMGMTAVRGHRHPPLAPGRAKTAQFHELGDGFPRDAMAPVLEDSMNARGTVALFAAFKDQTDLFDQRLKFFGQYGPERGFSAPGMEPPPPLSAACYPGKAAPGPQPQPCSGPSRQRNLRPAAQDATSSTNQTSSLVPSKGSHRSPQPPKVALRLAPCIPA